MDIDKVKELIRLMVDNDLLSISLRNGAEEITLRRPGRNEAPAAAPGVLPDASAPQPPAPATEDASATPTDDQPPEDKNLVPISSPMVGTYYASAHPGAPPFVELGSTVAPDTVVCIIEAMKVFNEIPAEVSGTIEQILVTNEHPVEYGQPLFMIRPN